MTHGARRILIVLAVATAAFILLPWYRIEDGFLTFGWFGGLFTTEAPGLLQIAQEGRWWNAVVLAILAGGWGTLLIKDRRLRGKAALAIGAGGLAFMIAQAVTIGYTGWAWEFLDGWFGALSTGQPAMGAGSIVVSLCLLLLIAFGAAELGALKGDAFILGSVAVLGALVFVFVFYPIGRMLLGAFQDFDGYFDLSGFTENFFHRSIWSLDCVIGGNACGVAWQTLWLAIATGLAATLLGLACALVATRSSFRYKKALRFLTVLPIISPPFVIGLALILLFGRSGIVTEFVSNLLGLEPGRWLYGLGGIWLAQVLSFTPICFLVLIGVLEGVSPSLEEASQTLRADRMRTFTHVTLPLIAPGLANAFLIGFIESMADFGNPLVLGGSSSLLSTEIYFAVVGAQINPSRAAVLAMILLAFTLAAFFLQRFWLAGKNFTTVTGKGDSGVSASLPKPVAAACYATVGPWLVFTTILYGLIVYGSFVKLWGLDNSLTIEHYVSAFSIDFEGDHLVWSGVAWNSFWTTMKIALVAAVLTAAVGILAAYLVVRQNFPGRNLFEFALMLSFAVPGTVIGVSYLNAFNLYPLEMTGSAAILIVCFVFRNMPVGVRGGIAAMSQLDKSLDEASLTLRANSARTLTRVVLPLLKPAITTALVYSFVRAVTSISAVIFLVSAEYNMATAFIIGLVENGQYGQAIAYSTTLIVVMLAVIVVMQLLVGKRRLRRTARLSTRTVMQPAEEKLA